jgi:YggT family protein
VQRICWQLTEPLMRPVRRALPDLGGLDISPIVVLLGLQVVHIVIIRLLTGTLI